MATVTLESRQSASLPPHPPSSPDSSSSPSPSSATKTYELQGDIRDRGGPGPVSSTPLCSMKLLERYYYVYYALILLTVFHNGLWALPLALVVPRMIQQQHYVHHFREENVPFVVRLSFFLDTPFSLGYEEIGYIHDTHHKYSCHPTKDLQYSIVAGSPYMGFEPWARNFAQPELDLYHYAYINKLPIDPPGFLLRLCLFSAIFYFFPIYRLLLFVWLPTRIQRCQFYLFAFHFQHRDGEEVIADGKNMEIMPFWRPIISFLNGHENVIAMEYHIVHHIVPQQPVDLHPAEISQCKNLHPDECLHQSDWAFPSLTKIVRPAKAVNTSKKTE